MNFQEARTKMEELAKGEYHTVRYELTKHHDGTLSQECGLYLNGVGWFTKSSWEKVFDALNERLTPVVSDMIEEDVPELPTE